MARSDAFRIEINCRKLHFCLFQGLPYFPTRAVIAKNKNIKILFGSEEGQLLAGLQASISGRGYSHLSILPDGKQIEVIFDLE